jgi:hypothetical protein
MRRALTLATCAALAACASPTTAPLEPGAYSLIATYPDGAEYVIDYNLSDTDCAGYARTAARANPQARMLCAVQPVTE